MDNKNYGVIQEQGFVVGNGLGFQPVKESELNPNNKSESEKETTESKEPKKTK